MTVTYGRFSARAGSGVVLDRDEALRYLGYAGQQVDEALLARFRALADACERDLEPVYAWETFDVDGGTSRFDSSAADAACVVLAGCGLTLRGADITRHLAGASKVALMACTLGMESEREYRRLAAISPADGAMFGSCCSALVEACANAVEAQVVAAAAQAGLVTNWRFSPGYGDLPLDVQPAFIRALDAGRRLGIAVTPTNMLVPVKSVTAVIGLFDAAAGIANDSVDDTCARCPAAGDCDFRKRGTTCHG